MRYRKQHTQKLDAANAKAGMGERTARRIEGEGTLPSQQARRSWRSRANPFAAAWDSEVVPLLKSNPQLMAITILRKLQEEEHPADFPDGTLRTLKRHIRQWRAMEGPGKEVFFAQE